MARPGYPNRGHYCLLALTPELLAMGENLHNATEEDIEAAIDFILRTHGTTQGKKWRRMCDRFMEAWKRRHDRLQLGVPAAQAQQPAQDHQARGQARDGAR